MKVAKFATALVGSAALVACGGDGGGSGGTPTPTPSPSPSPSPTFEYTKFADLTGDQSFATACIDAEASGSGALVNPTVRPMGDTGKLSFEDATDTWTIADNLGNAETFGPSELVNSDANVDEYEKDSGTGGTELFQIFSQGGSGINFEYMRSSFAFLFPPAGAPAYISCFFGVPTDPDDVPSAPTVTFTDLVIGGFVIDVVPGGGPPPSTFSQIVGGSGQLSGDTASGDLTIELNLTVEDQGGVQTNIGPIQGTVSTVINGDVAGYSGTLNTGGMLEYIIEGGNFGPEGSETGFVFYAALDMDTDGQPEQTIYGGVSAKR